MLQIIRTVVTSTDTNMSEPPGGNSRGENMDTSVSPDQSEHSTPSQAPEEQRGSVKCPNCKADIITSIKTSPDQSDFIIILSKKDGKKDNENQSGSSPSGSTCSQQAPEDQSNSVKCPNCKAEMTLLIKPDGQNRIFVRLLLKKNEEKNSASAAKPAFPTFKIPFSSTSRTVCIRPTVKVAHVDTGETFGAIDAIMEKVINNTWPSPQVKKTKLKDCDIIIVFCPIICRVGSDVNAAMKQAAVVQTNKPVILVLMHHTRDPDYSTEGIKWSDVQGKVQLGLHVFFHETQPGLLKCKHNDHTILVLQQELYKYSKK